MKLPIQLDRYTLVEPIGAGAFGRVYRAEVRGDMGFVSDFAVKVLDSNVVQVNPNVAAQMADEARLLSQLDHPNIVKVIDFKHVDHFVLGDVYMMVLEFVRGVDVAEVLEGMQRHKESIPASSVLHMGLMVADALTHAHSMTTRDGSPLGLVHRDLKPHNLMVNFRGQVKILDFGIAKAKSSRMAAATQEGQTKGTVFYMSPEQLAGEALDGRSDLYSLGTILYELLLGRRLIDVEVNTPADLARAMHTAFEMDVEERLEVLKTHLSAGHNGSMTPEAIEGWLALLRAVLQKDARYRPDNARIFAEQLEWLRNRHPTATDDRDFWVRVVEEVAAARAARGGPRMPPPPKPARKRALTIDELPALSDSAQDFFGMESGGNAEEAPIAIPRTEVTMTRAMSSVSGSVRTFGSAQVQQISPLTEVLRNIGQEGNTRADSSTDSVTVPPVSRPAARGGEPVEAPTVEIDSIGKKPTAKLEAGKDAPRGAAKGAANGKPARGARRAAHKVGAPLAEAPTDVPRPARKAAAVRSRKAAPSNRVPLLVMTVIGAILAIVVIALVIDRFTGGSDVTDEVVGQPETTTEDVAVGEVPAPVEAPGLTPSIAEAPTPEPIEDIEDDTLEDDGPEEPDPIAEARTPAPANHVTPPKARTEPTPAPRAAAPAPVPTPSRDTPDRAEAAVGSAGSEVGMLHISARPRCDVFIDGDAQGTTDDTRKGIALAPGTYKVRFVCADEAECAEFSRRSGKKTLVIEAGKKTRYHADFYQLNEKYQ